MTKAEGKQSVASSSRSRGVRGPYATSACDICRRKKIKCNEAKPICGSCEASNRSQECTWTGENVRVPRTEAHFESLRKRVEALQIYADNLKSMLEICTCQEHSRLTSNHDLEVRPPFFEDAVEDSSLVTDDIGQELSVSTQNLKLEDRDLVFHGTASPFRFAQPDEALAQTSRFPDLLENTAASYVLVLSDADEAFSNENLDWSRHLPPGIHLTKREHDKILDLVFKFFTSWCLRVVPALFLRDMYRALSTPPNQGSPKTPHYSPMLHNAIVALATAFSDDPHINDYNTRVQYAVHAKAYIEDEARRPNICVVQALSLLGSFHSSNGDQNLGYLYFGMSTRIGQILGLNVDCSRWVKAGRITHDDMLDRNWAYWTSFSLDVCWTLYVGRDFSVTDPSQGPAIPIPFVDSEFDQMPWFHASSGVSPQPNYLSNTFASTCELLMIARRIMEIVNGMNNHNASHNVNDEVVSKLDLQLNTWKGNLPPELDITQSNRNTCTPHRLMMHLLYWLCFILLHRPLFHRKTRPIFSTDKDIDHPKLCKRAADNIMDLLGTWDKLYGLRFTPVTLFQAVFSAGTVYLLLAVQAATGPRVAKSVLMSSLGRVELCIQNLREVGKSWRSASNIADILKSLLQDQLRPLLEKNSVSGFDMTPKPMPPPQRQGARAHNIQHRASPQSSPRSAATTQRNTTLVPPSPQQPFPPQTQLQSQSPWSGPAQNSQWYNHDDIPMMDPQTFLPLIGAEPLSDIPFVGLFNPNNISFDNGYLQHQLGTFNQGNFMLDIQDADLAMIQQYYQS